MLEQRPSRALTAAPPLPRQDALTRAADLVARCGREVSAVTVLLPALGTSDAERLDRACALAARERGVAVHVEFGPQSTTVRFARHQRA